MQSAATLDFAEHFASHLTQLPLILAGPILRRTEANQVSVWVALRSAATIELQIFPAQGESVDRRQAILQGTAATVAVGKFLHLALITAQAIGPALSPGNLYAYDLTIQIENATAKNYAKSGLTFAENHDESIESSISPKISLAQALRSALLPEVTISYFAHGLPTFSLPPQDLNHLKILHGSCRKLHDKEIDALPIVDQMIAESASSPNDRPHQLFFTGDQIYGDEVADVFLWAIQQIQAALFGWQETVLETIPEAPSTAKRHLRPGNRHVLAETHAGLTASLQGHRHKTQSHLFRFSEYCISYLFTWSECFWISHFPTAQTLGHKGKIAKRWNQQVQHLTETARSQPMVRRALANVPTYMIFDDHDVSDDWNLNQDWCLRVLGKPLGRQVVRNALMSYALFQGWGNTPEQFFPNTIGAKLLTAIVQWSQSKGQNEAALAIIHQAIGLPAVDPSTDLPEFQQDGDMWVLKRPENSLNWHYRVSGAAHEVLVLDTRTQRGYPIDQPTDAAPQLLSPTAFTQQLRAMLQAAAPEKMTFVVAPTNVFTIEILDHIQRLGRLLNKSFNMDIGDAWNLESAARLRLLQELLNDRSQIIILSGDIHFGAALRVDFWHHPPTNARQFTQRKTPPDACLVQLVASAICNSELLTEVLQTKIKLPLSERFRYWISYVGGNAEIEITPGLWRSIKTGIARWRDRHPQPPIHLGYCSQWLHRQSAQIPPWQDVPPWLQPLPQAQQLSLIRRFWRWRWLQEGKELVGINNIGLVQLQCTPDTATNVIYDLYWYAPWNQPHVVYSRYQTPISSGG
ncbi:MAG: hypothetical protein RLZZ511_2813 [Cyanobacteriota bacterium]|jgi:hypothetical protein